MSRASTERDGQVSRARVDLEAELVRGAQDGLILLDDQGRVLVWNPAATRLFGYAEDEVLGRDLHAILSPVSERESAGKGYARFSKTGRGPVIGRSLEFTALCKDGALLPVEIATSAHEIDGQWHAIGVVREISERRLAEEKMRMALREKDILIQEIHHRVKNNLHIISSLLGLQSQYVKDPRDYALFMESRDRLRSMALVHEELSRSGDSGSVNLKDYLARLVRELMGSSTGSKRIEYELQVEEASFPIDILVPCGLIVNELVTNALKHAFQGRDSGRVTIHVARSAGQFILSVSDDGVGFPPDVDFRAVDSLGLELVMNLVTQRKGSVDLARGKGTTFTIAFPLV